MSDTVAFGLRLVVPNDAVTQNRSRHGLDVFDVRTVFAVERR